MEFLTVKEVAKYLRVAPSTVYKDVLEGRLPCVRFGSSGTVIRITSGDVDVYVAERMRTQPRRIAVEFKHLDAA